MLDFTRDEGLFDIFSLAHIGAGALTGFYTDISLPNSLWLASGFELVENFVLAPNPNIVPHGQETIINAISDVVVFGLAFGIARKCKGSSLV